MWGIYQRLVMCAVHSRITIYSRNIGLHEYKNYIICWNWWNIYRLVPLSIFKLCWQWYSRVLVLLSSWEKIWGRSGTAIMKYILSCPIVNLQVVLTMILVKNYWEWGYTDLTLTPTHSQNQRRLDIRLNLGAGQRKCIMLSCIYCSINLCLQ